MSYLGTFIAAYGALKQGQAQQQAADFNASIAQQNAGVARQQAAEQAQQQDIVNKQRIGSIIAAQGASGGDMSGSALDVVGNVAQQGKLATQQALYEGELSARGYSNTAAGQKFIGQQDASAGKWHAAGALIQGASQAMQQSSSSNPGTSLTRF